MANNNGQQETAALVAQALEDFRKGMEYREQLSIRSGRRNTQIIRFGMTGLSILGFILFCRGHYQRNEKTVLLVNENIGVMPALDRSMRNITESMQQLLKPMKTVPF